MPTPDSPLPVGTVVGGYRVVGTAGDDVRFVHYDAVSTSTGDPATLSVPRVIPSPEARDALDARVRDFGGVARVGRATLPTAVVRFGDRVTLVSQHLQGTPDRSWIEAQQPIPFARSRPLIEELLDATALLHAQRIAHANLSPDALLLDEDGELSLRLAGVGDLVPTPGDGPVDPYQPPEALMGADVDPFRADVWAIGMCAWRSVHGSFPFPTAARRRWRMLGRGAIELPPFARDIKGVANEVGAVFDRAVGPPDVRPSNASVLRAVLSAAAVHDRSVRRDTGDLPVVSAPPSDRSCRVRGQKSAGLGDRGRVRRSAAVVALVALVAVTGAVLRARSGARLPSCHATEDCAVGLECSRGLCAPPGFVPVAPSVFTMGSLPGEPRDRYEPSYRARFTRPFWVGVHEVTQGEWQELMESQPSEFRGCGPRCPVESVSWYEAVAYANRLSEAAGLEPCYTLGGCTGELGSGCDEIATDMHWCEGDFFCSDVAFAGLECPGYRLPTELEWEYAARAGTTTAHYGGRMEIRDGQVDSALSEIAVYRATARVTYHPAWSCEELSDGRPGSERCGPHEVGGLTPNALRLHDMLGNVAEWTHDGWRPDPRVVVAAGTRGEGRVGPDGRVEIVLDEVDDLHVDEGTVRSIRGGAWFHQAAAARASARGGGRATWRWTDVGFRLVRTIVEPD